MCIHLKNKDNFVIDNSIQKCPKIWYSAFMYKGTYIHKCIPQ